MFGHSDRRARERLNERGQRAWASVLEIASEGKELSDEDGQSATFLKCRLRVEAADGFPFFFEDKLAFPQLGIPTVGARIAVVYDPKDHDTLLVDRSGAGPPSAAAPAQAPAAPDPAPATAAFNLAAPFSLDLGGLMKQVQEARALAGNDPEALAHELQRRFSGETGAATVIDLHGQTPFAWSAGATAPAPADDLDKLEKLADLKAKGVLTDAEFTVAKAKILGEPPPAPPSPPPAA
jgi:hypothetical protein